MTTQNTDEVELVEHARDASTRAYVPHSEHKVGAALLADNKVYLGANIEIAGWITSTHAEMLSVFSAVFDGATDFQLLAISTQTLGGNAPCGLCQHTIAEFCDDLRILSDLGSNDGYSEYMLDDLLGPAYRPGLRLE